MSTHDLEFFLHQQGAKAKVITASDGESLLEALVRSGVPMDASAHVFVGECTEALTEPDDVEDGADKQGPVDVSLTLKALDIGKHRHVHAHSCRHILVEVNFGGNTKRRSFSPATTVEVVTAWARKKFRLDAAAASEYVLQLCNSTEQPRSDKHLGELVESTKCFICFDLVKEVTPQG